MEDELRVLAAALDGALLFAPQGLFLFPPPFIASSRYFLSPSLPRLRVQVQALVRVRVRVRLRLRVRVRFGVGVRLRVPGVRPRSVLDARPRRPRIDGLEVEVPRPLFKPRDRFGVAITVRIVFPIYFAVNKRLVAGRLRLTLVEAVLGIPVTNLAAHINAHRRR